MDLQRQEQLASFYRKGLLEDTLPFWIDHCVDRRHGGFMMSLDRDGSLLDSDKGVWQQARFTWLLAELYNQIEPRQEWLDLAIHGAEFLDRHCFDPVDGRMWFHVTRQGAPIRKRRYAFSESFAAIAYGELAKATGSATYTAKAIEALNRFEAHHRHPPEKEAKFTSTRPTRSISFPMILVATAQQLRDSIGLEGADQRIDDAIESIRHFHLHESIECVMETVGRDGQRIDHAEGRTLNPGHAIEAAWFIMLEGKVRGDAAMVQMGTRMLDWMWRRGWDETHGGILSLVDVKGGPVQEYWHDMKFWWPHCETILATVLAYRLTGQRKYAEWHQLAHDWAFDHFPDPQQGEWFGYLHRDGSVSNRAKGNLWKGPFHLPRMQMLCSQWLQEECAPPFSET